MKFIYNRTGKNAFSLVEMMVVLTVVGVLMAFAAPNVFSLVQASTLSNEGNILRNQLTFAQQNAVSKNSDVEVRFFKWADKASAQTTPTFSAFQLYQYNSTGEMVPISSFFRIKAPSALNERLSTLLKPGQGTAQDRKYGFVAPHEGQALTPSGAGISAEQTDYVAFRFRPDGSTDLPPRAPGDETWYLMLVQGEGAALNSNLPRNYVCLQVNPYNGVVTEFRP